MAFDPVMHQIEDGPDFDAKAASISMLVRYRHVALEASCHLLHNTN